MPEAPLKIGAQASGPIPALFLGQTEDNLWLMQAALTSRRHVLAWDLAMPLAGQIADCRSDYCWTGGHPEIVPAGGEVTLETTLFQAFRATPDRLYESYSAELTARQTFAGTASRLAREPVYCTWNYGVFETIDEADCLARMDVVADAQGGGFFQLDHGYQPPAEVGGKSNGHADAYFPDVEKSWDATRFPSGARGFVAACRERGLRPALWWTPRLLRDGPITHAHPDWVLRDANETPIDVGHFCLDPSVDAARELIENCIRTLVKDWGFEGIKLDFYSYMFDHDDAVFRNGGTGASWKRWLLSYVREQLGPQGYFLHCISCPLGDPLLALDGPDAYRAGIDIHSGEWEYHVRGCGWLLPGVLANRKSTWFANIDSCLGHPAIPAVERRSRCAFAYMTGGMLEFSGPVETLDEAALDDYRALAKRYDQGGAVECPDVAAFYGRPLPYVLVRRHDEASFTRRELGIMATFGLFNWSDDAQVVALPVEFSGAE